ncbi:MAG TPA: BrnT family toxin [Terriglobales bacterium]|nr:BrnT family toxin [Terriglobales bacterium]
MRFKFDAAKSRRLRRNPKRGIGFEEAGEIFFHPYYLDQRSDIREQYRAIGWVAGKLYTLIFEIRDDAQGEYYRLITLWKSTREEERLYEESS